MAKTATAQTNTAQGAQAKGTSAGSGPSRAGRLMPRKAQRFQPALLEERQAGFGPSTRGLRPMKKVTCPEPVASGPAHEAACPTVDAVTSGCAAVDGVVRTSPSPFDGPGEAAVRAGAPTETAAFEPLESDEGRLAEPHHPVPALSCLIFRAGALIQR